MESVIVYFHKRSDMLPWIHSTYGCFCLYKKKNKERMDLISFLRDV